MIADVSGPVNSGDPLSSRRTITSDLEPFFQDRQSHLI